MAETEKITTEAAARRIADSRLSGKKQGDHPVGSYSERRILCHRL